MPEIITGIQEMNWMLPTPVQAEAIPLILGGGDVLAVRQGAAFLLDGLHADAVFVLAVRCVCGCSCLAFGAIYFFHEKFVCPSPARLLKPAQARQAYVI